MNQTDINSAGIFSPAPQRAPKLAILKSQGLTESKLMLKHGEQQLLSVIIPVAMLIAGNFAHVGPGVRSQEIFPMVLAVAATSAGFTGQAISLAFDRRYGALKRSGASGAPAWAIIGGKILAVLSMVILQVLILGTVAALTGFRTSVAGASMALVVLIVGIAAFSALGLLLGGRLSSEIVLAVANLVWFVFLGLVGWVYFSQGLGANGWFNVIPTVALAGGLNEAFHGIIPTVQVISLCVWAIAGAYAAVKTFKFTG